MFRGFQQTLKSRCSPPRIFQNVRDVQAQNVRERQLGRNLAFAVSHHGIDFSGVVQISG